VSPNEFDSSASGQPDEAHRHPTANPFPSGHPHGTFPRLTPRKFPDDEDAAPEPVPAMEPLPAHGHGFPPPTYGPPPSYSAHDHARQRGPADYPSPGADSGSQYGVTRAPGMAPPLPSTARLVSTQPASAPPAEPGYFAPSAVGPEGARVPGGLEGFGMLSAPVPAGVVEGAGMSESSQGESPEVFEEFRERWQRSIEVGHLEEAEEIIQRALAWAREHGDPRRIDSVVCALAAVAIHLGRGDGELPRLREILLRNGDAGNCRNASIVR